MPTFAPTETTFLIFQSSVFVNKMHKDDFWGRERTAFENALGRTYDRVVNSEFLAFTLTSTTEAANDGGRRLAPGEFVTEINYQLCFVVEPSLTTGDLIGQQFVRRLDAAVEYGWLESNLTTADTNLTRDGADVDVDRTLAAIESNTTTHWREIQGEHRGFSSEPSQQPTTWAPTSLPTTADSDDSKHKKGSLLIAKAALLVTFIVLLGTCACIAWALFLARREPRDADSSDATASTSTAGNQRTLLSMSWWGSWFGSSQTSRSGASSQADAAASPNAPVLTFEDRLKAQESYSLRSRFRSIDWEPPDDDGKKEDDDEETVVGRVHWAVAEKGDGQQRFVRRFLDVDGDDAAPPRTRRRRLELVSADQGVPLRIKKQPVWEGLLHSLEHSGGWTFPKRSAAFRKAADAHRVPWQVGRVEFEVRRKHVLEDAMKAIGHLRPHEWRRPFFVTFQGEHGLDAGGLSREFFTLVSCEALGADSPFFREIHGVAQLVDDDRDDDEAMRAEKKRRLVFVGRLLGKALLDNHLFAAHPSPILLKHMCCEPIVVDDLELLDVDLWQSLSLLPSMPASVLESLDVTFCIETVHDGMCIMHELCPGGANKVVTTDNVAEFVQLRVKERVLDACRRNLAALLEGVYDVLPVETLLLLTARELELTLCGNPEVPVDDWRVSTVYTGVFADLGHRHPVVDFFWTVVGRWDNHRRANLLQWATGSSRVPCQGFAYLQGRDGAIRPFTLTSVELSQAAFPRSHTCFNRIDLPLYRSEAELSAALDFVLSNAAAHAVFSID